MNTLSILNGRNFSNRSNYSNYSNLEFGILPPAPKGEFYSILDWIKCNMNFEFLNSLQGWGKIKNSNFSNSTNSVCLDGMNILNHTNFSNRSNYSNYSNYSNLKFGFLPPAPKGEFHSPIQQFRNSADWQLRRFSKHLLTNNN